MNYQGLNFDIMSLLPELAFLLLVLFLFISIVFGLNKDEAKSRIILNILPLWAVLIILATICNFKAESQMFWGSYQIDPLSQFFKLLVASGFIVAVLNARSQPTLEEGKRLDYFLFLSFSAFGLTLMASTVELLSIYLAMELASYSLYVLIPLRAKEKTAAEAGIKYILFGAAATALALYGLSWIIASQHTTYISELSQADWSFANNPMAMVGLIFFLGGMFYKLALFPFHFWCPDVYQGASNETATYVATLPKLGAIVVLVRLGTLIAPQSDLSTILAFLAAISMTFGNLCALAQKDLKRMLGFSSVAHAGYLLVGLVAGSPKALAAAAFYAVAYLSMNLLCFWVISRIATDGRNLTYKDLNGLSRRSPCLALSLTAAAISLVGLPPTIGFIGKFWLVVSAWGVGYNWLVIILCINSAIAIFYYLSLVRHAYTKNDEELLNVPAPDTSVFSSLGAVILAAVVVLLGIVPAPVFDWALKASSFILG